MSNFFEKPTVDLADASDYQVRPKWENATVNERFFGQEPTEAAPAPNTAAAAVAEGPPVADPALMQTLAALNQTVQQNSQVMANMAVASNPQSQVAAMADYERARANQQMHIQQLQPPQPPDPDELVTDGNAAQQFIEQSRSWALATARSEMRPMQEQMQVLTSLAEPLLDDARNRAWGQTAAELRQRGYAEETLPQLQQLVAQVAQTSYNGNWQEQQKFLMNPQGMRYAAEAAYEAAGGRMPVRNPSQPPVGAPQARGAQNQGPDIGEVTANDAVVSEVQSRLNIKLSPDSLAKLTDFRKRGAA